MTSDELGVDEVGGSATIHENEGGVRVYGAMQLDE